MSCISKNTTDNTLILILIILIIKPATPTSSRHSKHHFCFRDLSQGMHGTLLIYIYHDNHPPPSQHVEATGGFHHWNLTGIYYPR